MPLAVVSVCRRTYCDQHEEGEVRRLACKGQNFSDVIPDLVMRTINAKYLRSPFQNHHSLLLRSESMSHSWGGVGFRVPGRIRYPQHRCADFGTSSPSPCPCPTAHLISPNLAIWSDTHKSEERQSTQHDCFGRLQHESPDRKQCSIASTIDSEARRQTLQSSCEQ